MSSQDYQYDEGGGEFPPYKEDFFQRITQVSWVSGASFVAVEETGYVAVGGGSGKNWTGPFDPDAAYGGGWPSNNAQTVGASAAVIGGKTTGGKVVYVIVIPSIGPKYGDFSNKIMVSNDGHTWRVAAEYEQQSPSKWDPAWFEPWDPFTQNATGVVWNGSSFFASFYTSVVLPRYVSTDPDGSELWALDYADGERIYQSSDGESWHVVTDNVKINVWKSAQNGLQFGDGLPPGSQSDMPQHCIKPENEGGFPDGLQGYAKSNGTFAKPRDLADFSVIYGPRYHGTIAPGFEGYTGNENPQFDWASDPGWVRIPSSGLTVRTGGRGTSLASSVSGPCRAVTCYNGIWAATGHGFVDVSSGKDFKTVASLDVGVDVIGCRKTSTSSK